MTVEEKAKDLIEQCRSKILTQHSVWNITTENSFPMPVRFAQQAAVELALIIVNEIIDELSTTSCMGDVFSEGSSLITRQNYWESIRNEIKISK